MVQEAASLKPKRRLKHLLPLQRDLRDVAIALVLLRMGMGLAGVFLPLVLLNAGADLRHVAGYYLVYAVTKLFLNYPSIRFIQRYGAHFGLGVGFTCAVLQLVAVLTFVNHENYLILGAGAVSVSLANAFLWNSQHIHISRLMDETTKSTSIASIEVYGQLIDIIAPLVGGIIGHLFGAGWLVGVSIAVVAASLIPLKRMGRLQSKNEHVPLRYSLRGAPVRDLLANFSFNIETSIGVMLWPIFLAVSVESFQTIGVITAFAAVTSLVAVWIAGRRGDRGSDRRVLVEGAVVSSASHVLRVFVTSITGIALVSALYRTSLSYMQNAWVSTYYHHAKAGGLQYILSMEIACDIAYVVLWSVVLAVLVVTGSSTMFFSVAFGIAAVAALGCLAITPQKRLTKKETP